MQQAFSFKLNGKNFEVKIVLDPMGVDLFVIQDVATLIENLPPVLDNEDFAEEEEVVKCHRQVHVKLSH